MRLTSMSARMRRSARPSGAESTCADPNLIYIYIYIYSIIYIYIYIHIFYAYIILFGERCFGLSIGGPSEGPHPFQTNIHSAVDRVHVANSNMAAAFTF